MTDEDFLRAVPNFHLGDGLALFIHSFSFSGRRAIYREGIAMFLGEYLALFSARYFARGNGPLQRLVMHILNQFLNSECHE